MEAETSFGTNNPFRKRVATASAPALGPVPVQPGFEAGDSSGLINQTAPPLPHLSSVDLFQRHLESLPQSATPPPQTTFVKPKPKKKVRVQSPPPSSPESVHAVPELPAPGEAQGYDSDASSSSEDNNEAPEDTGGPKLWTGGNVSAEGVSQTAPSNPFQKTLQDLEQSSSKTSTATSTTPTTGSKTSLDVGSFGRLLMTGQAASSASPISHSKPQPAPAPAGDAASVTDASSISRHSIFDATYSSQETPRTSHETSDVGDEDHALLPTTKPRVQSTTATLRKKPPPPDSRHGKLIRIELKEKERETFTAEFTRRPGSGSSGSSHSKLGSQLALTDVNKPLPPAPLRSTPDDEESDSVFDRESAGKVPEIMQEPQDISTGTTPRPPAPPLSKSATPTSATTTKKPPPPPRRNTHGMPENRPSVGTNASAPLTSQLSQDGDQAFPRASLESMRSRSSSIRQNLNAPAPPPPRRPNHGRRISQPFISPSDTSSTPNLPSSISSPSVPANSDRASSSSSTANNSQEDSVAVPRPEQPEMSETAAEKDSMPTATTSAATLSPLPQALKKLSPPPRPPPARSLSTRSLSGRPPSVQSIDVAPRRIASTEKQGQGTVPPPPPPPRQRNRGGSRSSVEAAQAGPRRTSVDAPRSFADGVAEEAEASPQEQQKVDGVYTGHAFSVQGVGQEAGKSLATDILADLDALKKEVEAARGQFGQAGG